LFSALDVSGVDHEADAGKEEEEETKVNVHKRVANTLAQLQQSNEERTVEAVREQEQSTRDTYSVVG
jgi:hypothetical protein